ncbi:MAG: phage tail protein [Candidatus Limnocylindrales bacterium]
MRSAEIEQLLPAVYQLALHPVEGWGLEPDRRLGAVLDAMEALHDPIEQALHGLDAWIDPRRAPDAFVPWLASWVDLDRFAGGEVGPSAAETARLRELVAGASDLARWRGTTRGLVRFLEIATGLEGFDVDEDPLDADGRPRPFHVVVRGPAQAVELRPLIERIVESEKPAHVTCDLVLGEQA